MPKQERDLLKKRFSVAKKPTPSGKKKDYTLKKGKVSKFPLREKPEREKEAKQTRRGKRKKLKSKQLPRGDRIRPGLSTRGYVLEDATMDFSKPPSEQLEQFVYKRKDGEKSKKSMEYKDPVKKAKGGMVTKWESKWG